jgi:hypothetical protein
MTDHKTLKIIAAVFAVVFVSGCKKSPMDYYDEFFSARKLNAKKANIHASDSGTEAESTDEGYRDPITGQQVGGKEASQEATTEQQTDFAPLCSALVKTIRNEAWFYNFQSNIKKAQEKNEHSELIRSHMVYRRMLSESFNYSPEIFSRCAEAVLTIQSFPELRKLRAMTAEARSEDLSRRLTH